MDSLSTDEKEPYMPQIDEQTFTLLMARFDRLEEQGRDQTQLMRDHALLDEKVHAIVEKHQQYWGFAKWMIAPSGLIGAVVAWVFSTHK